MSYLLLMFIHGHQNTLGMFHGRLNGVDNALPRLFFDCYLIDDHLDVVYLVTVKADAPGKIPDISVNPGSQESLPADVLKKFFVISFASFDHGSHEKKRFGH